MTAAIADRDTTRRDGHKGAAPMAAATKIYGGTIVCLNAAGTATKGATSTTLKAVGVAEMTVDNSAGSAGDVVVPYRRDGWFRFDNSGGADAIALADVGADCYLVDDSTVAKTSGTNTRSVAGKVRDVDAIGVWISFN
ncbi:hypothetical protein [Pseudacidovorax intermedius]|uniref:hypothetical protein n=1 Tax=Pseudacidovorax intermedius TaxID=433924 RepID=UPI0026EBC8C4|nr:hypothetical protein [Pseudacidovorax intermedius]